MKSQHSPNTSSLGVISYSTSCAAQSIVYVVNFSAQFAS